MICQIAHQRALLLSTKEGDTVLAPFGGTGTTLRVCKQIGRPCTLIEISPFYCEKIAEEHFLEISDFAPTEAEPRDYISTA